MATDARRHERFMKRLLEIGQLQVIVGQREAIFHHDVARQRHESMVDGQDASILLELAESAEQDINLFTNDRLKIQNSNARKQWVQSPTANAMELIGTGSED